MHPSRIKALGISVVASAALAGCDLLFVDNFENAQDMIEAAEDITILDAEDMPDGRATMRGILAGDFVDGETYTVGDAEVLADFDEGSMDGTADDFVEYDLSAECFTLIEDGCTATELQSLEGELDISGAITDSEFLWQASGTLIGDFGGEEDDTGLVFVEGDGVFARVDGTLTAAGDGDGTVTVDAVPTDVDALLIVQQ